MEYFKINPEPCMCAHIYIHTYTIDYKNVGNIKTRIYFSLKCFAWDSEVYQIVIHLIL